MPCLVISPTRPSSPVRPLRLIRIPSTTRRMASARATKETDVKTPVPIIMIDAVAAIQIHIPCMAEGICFARCWPADIAGCVAALDVADINILLQKDTTAFSRVVLDYMKERSQQRNSTATLLEFTLDEKTYC